MSYIGTKPQIATTLADNIVTADKIASGAVTDPKIAAMAATKLTGIVPDANAPSGSVIQVVQGTTTSSVTTTSATPVDTNLTASITPLSASNRVLVLITTNGYVNRSSINVSFGDMYFYMFRGATEIASIRTAINFGNSNWNDFFSSPSCLAFFDTPNSTSSLTYRLRTSVSNSLSLQVPFQGIATITLLEIAA